MIYTNERVKIYDGRIFDIQEIKVRSLNSKKLKKID